MFKAGVLVDVEYCRALLAIVAFAVLPAPGFYRDPFDALGTHLGFIPR